MVVVICSCFFIHIYSAQISIHASIILSRGIVLLLYICIFILILPYSVFIVFYLIENKKQKQIKKTWFSAKVHDIRESALTNIAVQLYYHFLKCLSAVLKTIKTFFVMTEKMDGNTLPGERPDSVVAHSNLNLNNAF